MTGELTKQVYLYVKFELHGTRSISDIFGHMGGYFKTRKKESDGCKSSRKEKITGMYESKYDPEVLSPRVDQKDKSETLYYAKEQRLGCELYVGKEKTEEIFESLISASSMLQENSALKRLRAKLKK